MIFYFFFNDTATTEIYTLSLHDALPISAGGAMGAGWDVGRRARDRRRAPPHGHRRGGGPRSEEHTSELQSQSNLVCRLLLEKKKNISNLYSQTHAYRNWIEQSYVIVHHY